MDKTTIIYIVDDNASICDSVKHILSDYTTTTFHSGQALLKELDNCIPDVILMDVIMPEMDGFEVCEKIKADAELSHIPIIFLSSQDTLKIKTKGYAAGGDDYITKPFEPEEITVKVATAVRRKRAFDKAKTAANDAAVSAMDLMNTLSEQSIVLHFMQSILNCASYRMLAMDLIHSMNSLNLSIAIEFSVEDEREYFATDDEDNSLERSVFAYVRDKKHIIDVGKRCVFNYPTMSILVRNMPNDNPDLHGRLKDHVSVVGRAAESKLLSLKKDVAMYEQRNELIEILTELQKTIGKLETEYNEQQDKSRVVFSDVNVKVESSFMALGLTEEQEDRIREIIDGAGDTINELFDSGLCLEKSFSFITKRIEGVLDTPTTAIYVEPEENESKTSDIEFF
ncbi:MAG: response regulator [Pseudomonadota bacterium]